MRYKDLFHLLTIRYGVGLRKHGYECSISIKVRDSQTRRVITTFMENLAVLGSMKAQTCRPINTECNIQAFIRITEPGQLSIVILQLNGRPRNRGSTTSKGKSVFFQAFIPANGPIQPPTTYVPKAISPGVKRSELTADSFTPFLGSMTGRRMRETLPRLSLSHTHTHTHKYKYIFI